MQYYQMKKPTVKFNGNVYSLKSRNTPIPDLYKMTAIESLMWLNRFTYAKGYQKENISLPGVTIKNII